MFKYISLLLSEPGSSADQILSWW